MENLVPEKSFVPQLHPQNFIRVARVAENITRSRRINRVRPKYRPPREFVQIFQQSVGISKRNFTDIISHPVSAKQSCRHASSSQRFQVISIRVIRPPNGFSMLENVQAIALPNCAKTIVAQVLTQQASISVRRLCIHKAMLCRNRLKLVKNTLHNSVRN